MENIKELLKENIKGLENNIKQGQAIYKKLEELKKDYWNKKEEYKKTDKLYTIKGLEQGILKNNIHYLIQQILLNDEEIKEIQDKYKTKKIGEKTKEKIQQEIQEIFKKYNLKTYFYFNFDYNYSGVINYINFSLNIEINDFYRSIELKGQQTQHFKNELTPEKIEELKNYNWQIVQGKDTNNYILSIYDQVKEYIEIKEIRKKATFLYNKKIQIIKTINNLIDKTNMLYTEFDSNYSNYLNNYRITKNDINYLKIY